MTSAILTTPYRFFYAWIREETGWRIVVSHAAVSSRSPLDNRHLCPRLGVKRRGLS